VIQRFKSRVCPAFVVFALLWFGSTSALAGDLRFGIRTAVDFSSAFALQARVDFADAGDGFGVRGVAGIAGFFNSLEIMGFYHLLGDERGSGVYVGTGGGVLAILSLITDAFSGSGPFYTPPYVAGLIGYEYAFTRGFTVFAEFRPAFAFGTRNGNPIFLPLFGLGLNI
jgi:hypothetical protein